MKEFFTDIFQYHHHVNRLLLDQVELHKASLPHRTYSLLCHVLNTASIWNARILLVPAVRLYELHSFEECRQINDAVFKDAQSILSNYQLDKNIHYKSSAGKEFDNSVRDIFFHSANHSTHHKGQIISDFRLSGIEPLVTDYIFYKWNQSPSK